LKLIGLKKFLPQKLKYGSSRPASPELQRGECFSPGSLAVFIDVAPPRFQNFAGDFLAACGGESRSNYL